jgi:membrane associated rhomboid family serine protease
MIVPIGDAPNPHGVPWLTYLLILINVAVYVMYTVPLGAVPVDPQDPRFLAYADAVRHSLPDPALLPRVLQGATEYDLFVFAHGFRPDAMSVTDLLTSMFLHGGLLHLVGNMLFLWIYGDNVEHRLGPLRFLVTYLATGVAACLAHVALDPSSGLPMVGASGAISGVLGCYFVWFPRNHVRLLWLLPPFLMQVMLVPARLVLGFYLVLDNFLPLLTGGGDVSIAHAAHIGGFIAGALGAWLGGRMALQAAPADASTAGDALAMAEDLRRAGRNREALAVLGRYLRANPRSPGAGDLHAEAGDILLRDRNDPTGAYQQFVPALEQGASPAAEAVVRDGLATIASLQKRPLRRLQAV